MNNEINLGDLSKIKIDDELVTVYWFNDKLVIGNIIWQVCGINQTTNFVRVCKFGSSITRHSFNKNTGKCKNNDCYFSVNPIHIQKVKDNALKKLNDEKQEFIKSEKLKLSTRTIADALTWSESASYEIEVELSQRLTLDQIQTLRKWLGLDH